MADGDLCTVEQVEDYLATTFPAGAPRRTVERLISAASDVLKDELSDPILERDVDEYYDGTGQTQLVLRHRQVQYVTHVSIRGVPVPKQTDAAGSGWFLDGRVLVLSGYRFHGGKSAVRVKLCAGYPSDAIPKRYEDAVIDTVALWWKTKGKLDIQSETLAEQTITYVQKAMRDRALRLVETERDRIPA